MGIERAIMVTRPGSLMLLLAAGIVVIAALGSGTKHDPLPGANGMVDFLQADAVVTENTESSVNAIASSTCPFKNEDCCDETNIEARDTCLKSECAIATGCGLELKTPTEAIASGCSTGPSWMRTCLTTLKQLSRASALVVTEAPTEALA